MRGPISPHPLQDLSPIFLIITTLAGVKWNCIVCVICISIMTNHGKHLFMSLLVICTSSSEKCQLKILACFQIGLFAFLLLSWMSSLHILDTNPLSDIQIAYVFSHSVDYLFTLVMRLFLAYKFFDEVKFICFLFLVACAFGVTAKKTLLNPGHLRFSPIISNSFIVLALIVRFIIDFELIFVYTVRWGFKFILLQVDIQFSQQYFLKRVFFYHWSCLDTLIKSPFTTTSGIISVLLHSILSNYIPVFVPVPHCLGYYVFAVNFEIKKSESFFCFKECPHCSP